MEKYFQLNVEIKCTSLIGTYFLPVGTSTNGLLPNAAVTSH